MAIDFEVGSTQYIDLSTQALNTISPVTISLWWTPESHVTHQMFIGNYNDGGAGSGWLFYWNSAPYFRYSQYGNFHQNSDAFTPTDGVRYHIVLVYDKVNVDFYVNTTDYGGGAQNTDALDGSKDIYIAARNYTTTLPVDGVLEEFAIWDAALSVAEVAQLYSGGTPVHRIPLTIKPANLVGYWPMNDAKAGAIPGAVRDWSASGYDGTPVANPVGFASPTGNLTGPLPAISPLVGYIPYPFSRGVRGGLNALTGGLA